MTRRNTRATRVYGEFDYSDIRSAEDLKRAAKKQREEHARLDARADTGDLDAQDAQDAALAEGADVQVNGEPIKPTETWLDGKETQRQRQRQRRYAKADCPLCIGICEVSAETQARLLKAQRGIVARQARGRLTAGDKRREAK